MTLIQFLELSSGHKSRIVAPKTQAISKRRNSKDFQFLERREAECTISNADWNREDCFVCRNSLHGL